MTLPHTVFFHFLICDTVLFDPAYCIHGCCPSGWLEEMEQYNVRNILHMVYNILYIVTIIKNLPISMMVW